MQILCDGAGKTVGEFARRRITISWTEGQGLENYLLCFDWKTGSQIRGFHAHASLLHLQQLKSCLRVEGLSTCHHFIGNRAKRKDVGGGSNRPSVQLFWSHVGYSSGRQVERSTGRNN